MELEEERPAPPGGDFAQRVAYVIYAASALFTIALVLSVPIVIYLIFSESH